MSRRQQADLGDAHRSGGTPTNTAAARTGKLLWFLEGILVLVLAPARSAWAQPPETFTLVLTDSDHFVADNSPCLDEPYDFTITGHLVFHDDYLADADRFLAHFSDFASVVAVPVDGTGPNYSGHFSDQIRAVNRGDVLVQKDADLMRTVLHGSDESRISVVTHAQLTINANGKVTVQLEVDTIDWPLDRIAGPPRQGRRPATSARA